MNSKLLLLPLFVLGSCTAQKSTSDTAESLAETKKRQDEIIEKYVTNGAKKYNYYTKPYEAELDKGLALDSTIALLWQKKAMPKFKENKYEVGMKFLNKAVKYDREKWQDYRAFISCIFGRRYQEAIDDFEDYKKQYGNSYVMDHSFNFYIALSHLQLEEFETAEKIFTDDIANVEKVKGEDWVHHLDLFYLGITKYELEKYDEAIVCFDKALAKYPEFSEVLYYKALSLNFLYGNERKEEVRSLLDESKMNKKAGYTINEDNQIYTKYPYQLMK